jgi:hypothetical protein
MDTQTRRRTKSSTRRALESTVTEFDELLATPELKDAKRGDILIAKANALKELLALEAADRETDTHDTITRLEDQHATDTRRISALEFENATLRAKPDVIREVADPEHAVVRQQNDLLATTLKFIVTLMSETERQQAIIRALERLPNDAAKFLCQQFGLNYIEQVQMFNAYTTEKQLLDVITRAQREGPAVKFARAMLAIRYPDVKVSTDDWL